MTTSKDLSEQLASRVESVCRYLLPAGKRVADQWRVGDVDGNEGQSLAVRLTPGEDGRPAGLWMDYATGESGDILGLWIKTKNLTYLQAIKQVRDYLGIRNEKREFDLRGPSKHALRRPERPKCAPISKDMTHSASRYILEARKLSESVVKKYRLAMDSRRIIFPYLREGELVNIQYRHIDQKKTYFTKGCSQCLFGWQAISPLAKRAVITEGQFDCLTVAMFGYDALSLPNGIQGLEWIETDWELLEQFDELVLLLDNDSAGLRGISRLVERLGRHRCLVVTTPNGIKDANEALVKHGWGKREFDDLIQNAAALPPDELATPGSFSAEVMAEFYPEEHDAEGTLYVPFSGVSQDVVFPPGEITIWSGYTKHGKTTLLNQIIVHGVACGVKICDASLEMPARKTLKNMVLQVGQCQDASREFIGECIRFLERGLMIYDYVGTANVDSMLEVFSYAARRYGVKQFVIDSLMKLGVSDEDNSGQKNLISRLCDFKAEYNVHIHLVAHAKKVQDDYHPPNPMSILGSSSIVNMADNLIVVHRNVSKQREIAQMQAVKIDEKLEMQHDCQMIVYHQRDRGGPYYQKLWFNDDTLTFREKPSKSSERKVKLTLVK